MLEQEGGLTNYTKRSDTVRVTNPHVWTNHRIQDFWENQFFWFWGAPKNFFDPQKPYLAFETSFWGGHTSKTFWSEQWFWSYRFQNRYFLKKLFPIPWPRSKSLRSMTPSKVRFLRQYKVLRAQKSFFGPLKTQKIDFLKKGPSYNLSKT